MINEFVCYKCKCDKCEHSWITKTHEVPVRCAKCNSVKWNEFSEPATQIDVARTPQIVQPSQPIQDQPKDALAAFIAKAQAKKGIAPSEIITTENEPIDDGWIEMPTTIENGETLYWHRKIKGAPVCYKRETNWDNFA